MADIQIKHFPQMEIKKKDLILEITGDDGLLGHLYISKSSIDFLPRNKQFNTISMTWDKFVRLMEKVDDKREKKRKEKRKKDKK
jgi:hypothetical protein